MKYPDFLKPNGTIGVVAPSYGVYGEKYEIRYVEAKKRLEQLGYKIKECDHLFGAVKTRSASAKIRAEEFMKMYCDRDVDFIFSVGGGELMMETLPYLDFSLLKNNKPKYFMGFSDNTNYTLTLPIMADTAAIYGSCFGSFAMNNWDQSLKEAFEIITGKRLKQDNYDFYEKEDLAIDADHYLDGYNKTEKVSIQSLDNQDVVMQGRLIGGCLDVCSILCGNKLIDISSFLEKYKNDGFIWFLEACELSTMSQYRALWQLKQAGWFQYCKGIIYGRPILADPYCDFTLQDALQDGLGDLNVPIVYGCDFGHLPPSWAIISGAMAKIEKKNDHCSIEYILK